MIAFMYAGCIKTAFVYANCTKLEFMYAAAMINNRISPFHLIT